ncbi:MAG: PAS domain S-box protein [Gammaproteobacteria bacterium]|nr:PAS domain S-box protein [Gammaproteobacteria bacterium]
MTEASPPPPERGSAGADRDSLLHRNVLESMNEGVMTIDSEGRIGIVNPAASRLLGLVRADAEGKAFAEVFLQFDGLEEFSDTVLAAVYDRAVGTRSTVRVRLDDDTERSLAVTTSYLVDNKDGETRRIGIVAVFNDITEIEALRKAEQELTASTQEQNVKLQDAYREIENVLGSMNDGVMTIDSEGRIGMVNPAASRLLGLAHADVEAKAFAEVFLQLDGLEEFSDTVLAAVYDRAVGTRSTVRVRLDDDTERSLAVTTSYLVDNKDGETRRIGIVAVFNDITEIEALRKAEQELTASTQEQNAKLRDAYREIEDKNNALSSVLKKVAVVRWAAMVLVAVLFGGAAWYVWNETGAALRAEITATSAPPPDAGDVATVTVAPRPFKTTLSFVGRLAPRKEVRVTSPIAGKVARVLFEYGGRVPAGKPLVELDTAKNERQYRSGRAEYLEARDRLRELENWENSPEMARVRRAVVRAKLELEARKNKIAETALLLDKGIIPASEHEASQRQYDAQQLSYEAAVQALEAAQVKADEDALQIARLKLENAEGRMRELEATIKNAVVHAPVSGIVLEPGGGGKQGKGEGSDGERLAPGRTVGEGGFLLTLGDLDGLSVVGAVDEVDVVRLRPGLRVRISGDAFSDLELEGRLARISSQSKQSRGRNVPTFEVAAVIDNVSERNRRRLRLGMSASVVVVVRDEPAALLVPLTAVHGKQGKHWVGVWSREDEAVRRVPVEIGATTLREVEIVSGLKAGDEVIVSGLGGSS